MAIKGDRLPDPMPLTEDKAGGINEVEILVFVSFVKLPGIFLQQLIQINDPDNATLENNLTDFYSFCLAYSLRDQGESFPQDKIRRDEMKFPVVDK